LGRRGLARGPALARGRGAVIVEREAEAAGDLLELVVFDR
jgi:hypothetical protein